MTLRVYFVRRSLVLISFRCKIWHLPQQILETVLFLHSFQNLIIVNLLTISIMILKQKVNRMSTN